MSSIEGIISLGVGEPDFATPWHIREAAIESIEKGQTMYTSNFGTPELRRELARHLKNEYDVAYDPTGEILITVGVSEALDLAMRATIEKLLQLALGWGLLFLGIIGLFLPILQGILFIMLGLMVLSYHMPWAERLLARLRGRFPKIYAAMHEWAEWGRGKLHAWGWCKARRSGDN